ncbi:hypothetical protein [Streptomyces sp. NPDC057689]|uniref:hypothetical protein n=1 Tax=Streptomyces sp. NPDC057689 TaxID=3346213 RepID=UPI0036BDCA5E
MTNFAPGAVLGVPVWLAVCALVALSSIRAAVSTRTRINLHRMIVKHGPDHRPVPDCDLV